MKSKVNKFENVHLENLNLKGICRFCLSENNILLPIFGHPENDRFFELPSHIVSLVSVEMEENDDLPSLICHSCLFNFEQSMDFKSQCEQADFLLRRFIQENNSKLDNSDAKEHSDDLGLNVSIPENSEISQREEVTERKDSACQAEIQEEIINDEAVPVSEGIEEMDRSVAVKFVNTSDANKLEGDGSGKEDKPTVTIEPENSLQMEENMNDMEENRFGSEPFSLDLCSVRLRSECNDAEMEDVVVYPTTHLTDEEQWSESGSDARYPTYDQNNCGIVIQSMFRSDDFDNVEPVHVAVGNNHCPACNKGFVNMSDLQRHQLIHKQEPPYPCDYCEQEFDEKTLLKAHWRSHARNRPHMCLTCGAAYSERAELLKHFAIHDLIKPYHCPGCGKAFAYRSDLRKHAIIHTGARPFKCPVCGKTFTRSTNLNKHARVHSGRRPYPCEHCDKMFSSRGDLVRHAVIHTGEKPYACLICSLAFNRKDKLSRHERVHMTDRPFVCNECPTSFHRKEELTKHCRFHHFKPDPEYFTSATE